tara:strand:+ start:35 stop:697 length:663 start_codon:yes stop_codon:yes gene_type:complete
MAVGRPISLTPNVARKIITVTATASQTDFTPSGGYRINQLAVFRNGIRLVQGQDYTAVDGTTVTLTNGATLGDVVEFQIFDSFNIADALSSNGNQVMGGDLTVGVSTLYSGATGILSTNTIYAETIGDTRSTIYGDGGNLTNVISGVEVQLSGTTVGTSATVLNFGAGFSTATPVSAGISTIETTRTLTIGVRSGAAVTFSISGGSFNVVARSGNVAIDV